MRAPIVINDSLVWDIPGDLCVYDSVERAESALEYDNKDDASTHIFDADGRCLKIAADEGTRCVSLEVTSKEARADVLKKLVAAFLERDGARIPENASLENLLTMAYRKSPNPYSGGRG